MFCGNAAYINTYIDPNRDLTLGPLNIGAGGWLVGGSIAGSDDTIIGRADTFGAYWWNGSRMVQLCSTLSMPSADVGVAPSQWNVFDKGGGYNRGGGAYEVAVVKFKSTADSGDGTVTEGEWAFVENLGFSAKFSSLTRFPKSTNTTRVVRELIKVEP